MARNAVVSIILRAKDLTGRVLGRATRGVKGFTDSLFNMRTLMATIAGSVLVRFTAQLYNFGTAVEETQSKFNTVFGESAGVMEAFNKEFGNLAGLSETQARELTATTGAIAQGFGFAGDEAVQLTQQIATLGGDLASFNNLQGGTADGIAIINRGLSGEFERLKSVGIVLRAQEVDQRALLNTGKATVRQLTEQERVTARLQLINEKAGVAVGDLVRTQDSLANQTRRVLGHLRTLRDEVGVIITEVFKAAGGFGESSQKIQDFTQTLRENRQQIVAWGVVGKEAFDLVFSAAKTGISVLVNLLQILASGLAGAIRVGRAVITGNFRDIPHIFQGVKEEITSDLQDIADSSIATSGKIDDLVGAVRRAIRVSQGLEDIEAPEPAPAASPTTNTNDDAPFDISPQIEAATTEAANLVAKLDEGLITTQQFKDSLLDVTLPLRLLRDEAELNDRQLLEVARSLNMIKDRVKEIFAEEDAGETNILFEEQLSFAEKLGQTLTQAFSAGESFDELLARIAGDTLGGFGTAVEGAFKAVVTGSESAGKAFSGAMLNAIASVASAQGKLFLAESLGALGRGLLGNPAAFAAAGKFAAAATAMFALAGALGGVAGGASGGGGGLSSASGASQQQDDLQGELGESLIIVEGGFLDMSDPRQAEAFTTALNQSRGRRFRVKGA